MRRLISILTATLVFLIIFSCRRTKNELDNKNLFAKDNLVAWCVVPFDSVKRTPADRVRMLSELGFKQFAYDWRAEHLSTFAEEIKILKENNIKLKSVWLWIDTDSGEIFDDNSKELLRIIKENEVKTDFWLGFSNKHFDGLTDEQKLEKAVASVGYIQDEAKKLGCTVSLYNHGDWFGEPINQVRIIEKMATYGIGIVYNFHHAHLQVQEFPDLLQKMLPYLNTINLNGMKVEGPKILTIGEGDKELEMLKTLRQSRYNGSIGIICHIETEDAKVVLDRNLKGLQKLLREMDEKAALETY